MKNVLEGFITSQLLLDIKKQAGRAVLKSCCNLQLDNIYLWGVKDVFDLHKVGDVPGVLKDGGERKTVIPHKC